MTITDAIADAAPHQKINLDPPEQKAIIKFDRKDITVLPVDIYFEVSGHFIYNGESCQFVGSDDIMKVQEGEVPDNNGNGPEQTAKEKKRDK